MCWAPYTVLSFYVVLRPGTKVTYTADFVTSLLALTNSALNPYIFMLLNRDFRYALRLTIARCMSCVPGQADAVHRVRLSVHGDSMVDSARLPSRASGDSGVEMETCLQREPSIKDNHLCPPAAHGPPAVNNAPANLQQEQSTSEGATAANAGVPESPILLKKPPKSTNSPHLLALPPAPRGRPKRSREKQQYDAKALNTRRTKKDRVNMNRPTSPPGQDTTAWPGNRPTPSLPSIPQALSGLLTTMCDIDNAQSVNNKVLNGEHSNASSQSGLNPTWAPPSPKRTYMDKPIPIIMISDDTLQL